LTCALKLADEARVSIAELVVPRGAGVANVKRAGVVIIDGTLGHVPEACREHPYGDERKHGRKNIMR
jgi:hypothetical protein